MVLRKIQKSKKFNHPPLQQRQLPPQQRQLSAPQRQLSAPQRQLPPQQHQLPSHQHQLPPQSQPGNQIKLIPRDGSYTTFHTAIEFNSSFEEETDNC